MATGKDITRPPKGKSKWPLTNTPPAVLPDAERWDHPHRRGEQMSTAMLLSHPSPLNWATASPNNRATPFICGAFLPGGFGPSSCLVNGRSICSKDVAARPSRFLAHGARW
jgi:hypothetical protein